MSKAIKYTILGCLENKWLTSRELIEEINTTDVSATDVSEGTIWGTLSRLRKDEMVLKKLEDNKKGISKYYYKNSQQGSKKIKNET